jgi:hypothetical protein
MPRARPLPVAPLRIPFAAPVTEATVEDATDVTPEPVDEPALVPAPPTPPFELELVVPWAPLVPALAFASLQVDVESFDEALRTLVDVTELWARP